MRVALAWFAAVAATMMPVVAHAGSLRNHDMHSAAGRARDHAIIRRLNRDELAMVRRRDAGYAEGWRAAREDGGYAVRSQGYRRRLANYARRRARYERHMAAWRRAVAACRRGDYSACDT